MRQARKMQLLDALLGAAIVVLTAPAVAHAYIDPGSGSMLWQVLIAAFLTIGFLMRKYIRRLPGLRRTQETGDDRDGEPTDELGRR